MAPRGRATKPAANTPAGHGRCGLPRAAAGRSRAQRAQRGARTIVGQQLGVLAALKEQAGDDRPQVHIDCNTTARTGQDGHGSALHSCEFYIFVYHRLVSTQITVVLDSF